jgi:hypothetical protein
MELPTEYERQLAKRLLEEETDGGTTNTLLFEIASQAHNVYILLVWVLVVLPLIGIAAAIMLGIMAAHSVPVAPAF